MKYCIFLILIIFSATSYAQSIQDESYLDTSFIEFRQKLEFAISKKDTNLLKPLLADYVHESRDICGYPGCSKSEFLHFYFNENGDESWDLMKRIVRFGFYRLKFEDEYRPFSFEPLVFRAPSFLKKIDTGTELVTLGENINIREKPSLSAPIIRKSSYEKFKCDCNIIDMKETTFQQKEGILWIEVYLPNGKMGYVAQKLTSYSVEREILVAKVNGDWKIISFYYSIPGC